MICPRINQSRCGKPVCGFPSENHLQMVDEFNIELLVYLMVKTIVSCRCSLQPTEIEQN
jgi:hypothetical protein